MKKLQLMDMTLRQTDKRELSFKEKLEIARTLDRLKVDVIELPPISGSRADQLANRTIASMVSTGISAAVDAAAGNIDETWESIRGAKHPSLNILAPVSTVLMEYTCHKKAPAMLESVVEQVKQARFRSEKVELSAVDATRAEPDFLCSLISAAIEAGATAITICDTAGIMLPDAFGTFIAKLKKNVPELASVSLNVQADDSLSMALACAAAAVREGAEGIKCAAMPGSCPTLESVARFISVKGSELDVNAGIRQTELHRGIEQIGRLLQPEQDAPRFQTLALDDASGVCLDSSDSITEVTQVARQLGYDLSEEDNLRVYEEFTRVAQKKHFVGPKELDAIIASAAMQVPSTYKVQSYVINSGNIITATANILLEKDGEQLRGVGIGDGPIDAAFLAIEQIIGHHYELDDFQIQTVTEGRDAMGSALVKLRAGGRLYSGNGISTDIIGASIRAYVSALNKIAYEEA